MNASRAFWFAAPLTLALSACVPGDNTVGQNGSGPVGPGSVAADALSVGPLFQQVCVETAPSFRNAKTVLAKLPFRQHPDTGTFYHQNLDLSIKLMPHQCSMVFGSRDKPSEIGIILAAGVISASGSKDIGMDPDTGASRAKGPKGTTFEFDPSGQFNGRKMYHAVLIAP